MPNPRASRAVTRKAGRPFGPEASKHGTGPDLRMGMGKSVTGTATFAITPSARICLYWALSGGGDGGVGCGR